MNRNNNIRLILIEKCILISFIFLNQTLFAQDAKPNDRNEVNSKVGKNSMVSDSPVIFPNNGPIPPLFIPDIDIKDMIAETDYFIFKTPCRTLKQINEIQNQMPVGSFTIPKQDWKYIQNFQNKLKNKEKVNIMGLGDSIINDTMRSGWIAKLEEAYSNPKIDATVYVRGGGGCQHYKNENRINKYLVPLNPNLVIIGGISQQDIQSISEVIDQIRLALPKTEFLLVTGTFGTTDLRDSLALSHARHSGTGQYGKDLKKLARTKKCAFLDMTTPWAEYINTSKVHPHLFYRDVVHANEYGEQILSKIMLSFLKP